MEFTYSKNKCGIYSYNAICFCFKFPYFGRKGRSMANQKHLTTNNRVTIEKGLDNRKSFKAIASDLDKDCTTISKEVRNHRLFKKTGAYGHPFNNCLHRYGCSQKELCDDCSSRQRRRCCFCAKCSSKCSFFEKEECVKIKKAPYVCNGCDTRSKCTLEKAFYQAVYADREYRSTLSESRSGQNISEEELASLDAIVSPLLRKGQSIHHILASHKDEIMYCEKTLYAYVNNGLLDARNIDMPRKVRLRPRKGRKKAFKVDKKCRVGRTFDDFKAYREQHPDTPYNELDSVEGVKGSAVLLTIHFVRAKLQLAFKRDSNDSKSVTDIFNRLYGTLGAEAYSSLFPVLLADNGSEFSNPTAIELDPDGGVRSRLFYCDPSAPGQKGHCENNHEFIRRIIPKGVDIGRYSDEQIALMMDHINSYGRPDLNDKSPYEMFAFLYGGDFLEKLGVHPIPRDDLNLTPSLMERR